jgi:hypothetical protein
MQPLHLQFRGVGVPRVWDAKGAHTLCISRPLHSGVFGYRIPPLRRYSWFVAQCCMNSVHSSYFPCPYYYTISTTSVLTPLDVKFSCLPCEGFFRVLRLWESEGTIQLLEFLDTCHSLMLQQWIKHVLSCPQPHSPPTEHINQLLEPWKLQISLSNS